MSDTPRNWMTAQEFLAQLVVGLAPGKPVAHFAQPLQVGQPLLEAREHRFGWRPVGNLCGQRRSHGVSDFFLALGACVCCTRLPCWK